MQLTERPSQRYKDLLTMVAPASRPEMSKAALQQVIDRANGNAGPALSEHIAENTPLSIDEVKPAVKDALASLPEGADSAAKADAAKQAVTELVPKVNLELSEAVMLDGTVRTVFAGLFTLIFLGGIFAIVGVGTESHPSQTTLIALVVVTVLALLVPLVLVMGYKNVKVKVEPTSA